MPAGRPTKYKKQYVQDLIDYFCSHYYEDIEIPHFKDGEVKWTDIKRMPNPLPTLIDFAKQNDLGISTIYNWIDPNHSSYKKEFSDTYKAIAKKLQKNFIIQNGLQGLFTPQFTKFVAVNLTDMRDKQETIFPDREGNPQDISGLSDLDAAVRINQLIMEALKRKKDDK